MSTNHIASLCAEVASMGDRATAGPWEADNWETTVQTEDQIVCVSTTANRENDTPFIAACRMFAPAAAKALPGIIYQLEMIASNNASDNAAAASARASKALQILTDLFPEP